MEIRKKTEELRKRGTDLVRYCSYREGNLVNLSFGRECTAPFRYNEDITLQDGNLVSLVYNGGGKPEFKSPEGYIEGTELSHRWIDFMLDPVESPWRDIIPFVTNPNDIDWINDEGGVILEHTPKIGGRLFGSFWIALRFAQEKNKTCEWWDTLVIEHGLNRRMALAVSCTINSNGVYTHLDSHFFRSGRGSGWVKDMYHGNINIENPMERTGVFCGGDALWVCSTKFPSFTDNQNLSDRVKVIAEIVEKQYE